MPIQSRWSVEVPQVSFPTYLFESALKPLNNEKPVLIESRAPDTHFLTYAAFRLWCQRFAAGLRSNGFQKGDRVLLFAGNSIYFSVVIVGTIMAGGIFTGANPSYTARELAYQATDSGAKFLITSESSIETAAAAAKLAKLPESSVFIQDDGFATFEGRGRGTGNVRHWTQLVASEDEGRRFQWENLTPEEAATTTVTLNYSSGTTGVPKGVEITHKNYIANCIQMEFQGKLQKDWDESLPRARWLCFLPMYHAMAQSIFGTMALKLEIPVYMMPKFDFVKMLENIEKFKITSLLLVPPVVVAMAKSPLTRKYDLSSVERVSSGAAPLRREIAAELEKLWPPGRVNVKQGWGMSEITCSAMGWHPDEHSDSFSVGNLNANCQAMLVDEEGKEVEQGERGEILIKAPNVMKGYWRRPDATAETFTTDGWLKTGDVAYYDEHERFYIVDRKKELIKVKGNQVAPAELEALLLDHPAIADVAVIGVTIQDEEMPRAYVALAEGKQAGQVEIQKWMEQHVTRHKYLTGGVKFSGKILRKLLRDEAKAEMERDSIRAKL
ncbi:putative 4-coumarate-CoA ligase [Venturia nashicola]|nr:putative 4-coumarate-CoA ligase [Venturia nashicola]